jgi:hypothetical protein
MITLGFFFAGFYTLVIGKFPSLEEPVTGSPARRLGVWMMLPLPVSVCSYAALGSAMEWPTGAICGAISELALILLVGAPHT